MGSRFAELFLGISTDCGDHHCGGTVDWICGCPYALQGEGLYPFLPVVSNVLSRSSFVGASVHDSIAFGKSLSGDDFTAVGLYLGSLYVYELFPNCTASRF